MISDLFPVKIYKTQFTGNLQEVKELLEPLINSLYRETFNNNQGSMRGEGICSYVTKRDLHVLPEFKQIVEFIEEHAAVYHKQLNYSNAYTPRVVEMWFNVYKKDSFIDVHNHAPTSMTSSFYIEKDADSGNIVFENPLSSVLKFQPYHIERNNYHLMFEEEVDAKSGDLVIFPGWLNHKTRPNINNKDRIIIGTNIVCKG